MKILPLAQKIICGRFGVVIILCLWELFHLNIVCSDEQLTANLSEIEDYVNKQSKTLDLLLGGYDRRFIPAIPDKPLKVELQVVVDDVLSLDDSKMESQLILFIRQTWHDRRLTWNSTKRIKVREHFLDKIWLPDIRIRNVKDMKRFEEFGGTNMNLHPDGKVYYSQWILVTTSCPMDLRNFPMDKQTCFLNFSSYAYGKSLLVFSLAEKKVIVKPIRLPQFDFVKAEKITSEEDVESLIPQVTTALMFRRRVGYYILQIYVPSIFLVILSWFAFLMDASNIADRLAIEVTMILSIVFMLGSINTSLPHVSYPKASDWFVIVSFAFIFMALLETMLVYSMTSRNCSLFEHWDSQTCLGKCCSSIFTKFKEGSTARNIKVVNNHDGDGVASAHPTSSTESDGEKSPRETFWVDKICTVAFPVIYLIFNVFYWQYYL